MASDWTLQDDIQAELSKNWFDQPEVRAELQLDPDMIRQDFTMKSNQGFLGQIKDKDGYTMTEQSIDVDLDLFGEKKKYHMPLLVPGLNKEEIAAIKANEKNTPAAQSAYDKAVEHGKQRLLKGKDPFFQEGEDVYEKYFYTDDRNIVLDPDEVPIGAEKMLDNVGKEVKINKSIVDQTYDKLLSTEGAEGDKASDVATGKRGLTTKLFNNIKKKYKNEKMTEEEASKIYLQESYDAFSQVDGFKKLTQNEQIAILDNAYNLGYENMLGYKNFMAALKDGTDKDAIFKNLLDTAKSKGKSVKGIAKRRAEAYNIGNPDSPITKVEQTDSGIIYYKGDKEYFRFDAPRSEVSSVGTLEIK